jgi:hypothetical protein
MSFPHSLCRKPPASPFSSSFPNAYSYPPASQAWSISNGPNVPDVPRNYIQFALGPPRETPREAKGTLTGAGQLSMPVGQLALWDTVVLHRDKVIKPSSWQILQSEASLPDGTGTSYGMGYFLSAQESMHGLWYRITGSSGITMRVSVYITKDGKLDQLLITRIQ